MRARKDIAKDELLITELPIIIAPKYHESEEEEDENLNSFCVGCFEFLKVVYHKCPSCLWPACSSNCKGLTNPDLHDIECQLLRMGKVPAYKMNIRSVKDYYRTDALAALKILILQRKNPKKFKAIMDLESNENKRAMTMNFK